MLFNVRRRIFIAVLSGVLSILLITALWHFQYYSDVEEVVDMPLSEEPASLAPIPISPVHIPLDPNEDLDIPLNYTAPTAVGEGTANATFVFLCRNSELEGVLRSMKTVQKRFNDRFGYPWVFLNEEKFTDAFKTAVRAATKAPVTFGIIPRSHWYQPDWIDEQKATNGRLKMQAKKIIYAGSVPYRNMCRFNSGFFFHHPLLQPYKYYWRVEPDIEYHCDMSDPFIYMQEHNKIYGFTITFYEWKQTIPTLWNAVKEFMHTYPQYIAANNSLGFLSDDGGKTYNLCHFWSNFEIADMDFWRSEAYQTFFDFLESKGGFYYERWGDAPVHSIAAALFAPRDQLHFFRNVGYKHAPYESCPTGDDWKEGNCDCNRRQGLDSARSACVRRFDQLF